MVMSLSCIDHVSGRSGEDLSGGAQAPTPQASLDLQATIIDVTSRNRHVSAIALLQGEGSEGTVNRESVVTNMEVPDADAVKAANSAFFPGEECGAIRLAGRDFRVAERRLEGEAVFVFLTASDAAAEASEVASERAGASGEADWEKELLKLACSPATQPQQLGVAETAGAFLGRTRHWVLAVLFEPGMETANAFRVCVGVTDFLESEGQ